MVLVITNDIFLSIFFFWTEEVISSVLFAWFLEKDFKIFNCCGFFNSK